MAKHALALLGDVMSVATQYGSANLQSFPNIPRPINERNSEAQIANVLLMLVKFVLLLVNGNTKI